MKAFCFASGQIDFTSVGDVPMGAIHFASGPKRKLVSLISATARHAYDGETLLVPGVPEAPNQTVGLDALRRWCDWLSDIAPDGVDIY